MADQFVRKALAGRLRKRRIRLAEGVNPRGACERTLKVRVSRSDGRSKPPMRHRGGGGQGVWNGSMALSR